MLLSQLRFSDAKSFIMLVHEGPEPHEMRADPHICVQPLKSKFKKNYPDPAIERLV